MIKVFIGPMFSRKSNELINEYKKIWRKDNVVCFKPQIDDRDMGVIKSRDHEEEIKSININYFEEIEKFLESTTRTVFIDEAEFLNGNPGVLLNLSLQRDIDFYIAGLALTAEQKPFGEMPTVLSIASEIVILKGVCYDCNKPAEYSYYEGGKDVDILVGSVGYVCLCSKCLVRRREEKEMNSEQRLVIGSK